MTNLTKFFPTTKEAQDIVLWVDDIEASVKELGIGEAIGQIMDRVISGDLKCSGYVHVIDDNKELATNMAYLLDANYIKEMELMKNIKTAVKNCDTCGKEVAATYEFDTCRECRVEAKKQVEELVQKSMEAGKPAVNEDKNAAARAFLNENGPAVINSKKSTKTNTKEEKKMEETKKVSTRRRIAAGTTQTKTNEKVETEMKREAAKKEEVKVSGTRRRISSGKKEEVASKSKVGTGRKRIKRSTSLRGAGYQKHDGQWWSNVSLYPELEHVQSIVDSYDEETGYFSCPELDIQTIAFVEPTEISRYRNRTDLEVVIQLKSNGTVLEFPIKEAASNSKSPLSSSSIGWVEYNGKVRPAFGFWRPNALEVELECSCGNKFKANTGNVYCPKCRTRHDDAVLEVEHNLEFVNEIAGWVFQEAPNVVVPKAFLAIVMAMAHYEAGYDMEGLVEEDAE